MAVPCRETRGEVSRRTNLLQGAAAAEDTPPPQAITLVGASVLLLVQPVDRSRGPALSIPPASAATTQRIITAVMIITLSSPSGRLSMIHFFTATVPTITTIRTRATHPMTRIASATTHDITTPTPVVRDHPTASSHRLARLEGRRAATTDRWTTPASTNSIPTTERWKTGPNAQTNLGPN